MRKYKPSRLTAQAITSSQGQKVIRKLTNDTVPNNKCYNFTRHRRTARHIQPNTYNNNTLPAALPRVINNDNTHMHGSHTHSARTRYKKKHRQNVLPSSKRAWGHVISISRCGRYQGRKQSPLPHFLHSHLSSS